MRTITTIILSLMTMAIQAQTVLTRETNSYLGTGRHIMQQIKCAEVTKDSNRWDFSNMEIVEQKHTVWHVDKEDSLTHQTLVVERGTRHTYCLQGDSLLICSYRGRLSEIKYDGQEAFLLLPMTVGDSVQGIFHGRGTYGDKMAMRQYGRYKTKAVSIGTLVLPDNESLRNVLHVHTEKTISSQYYPINQLDSLPPYTTDSVKMYMQKDSSIIHATIDRWYAPGYRYPIIEKRQVAQGSDIPLLKQVLYYPSEQQESDNPDDEENTMVRSILAALDRQGEAGGSERNNIRKKDGIPVRNVKVKVNGTSVSVSYDLTSDATIRASVCDVSGIVYRQQVKDGLAGDSYMMTIECDGLRHGQYVLYMNVNGQVASQAISL